MSHIGVNLGFGNPPATIYRKLKRFGIRPPALRGTGRAGAGD